MLLRNLRSTSMTVDIIILHARYNAIYWVSTITIFCIRRIWKTNVINMNYVTSRYSNNNERKERNILFSVLSFFFFPLDVVPYARKEKKRKHFSCILTLSSISIHTFSRHCFVSSCVYDTVSSMCLTFTNTRIFLNKNTACTCTCSQLIHMCSNSWHIKTGFL